MQNENTYKSKTPINPNKIITITKHSDSVSWRNNLENILNGVPYSKGKKAFINSSMVADGESDLIVNNNVFLHYEDKRTMTFNQQNTPKKPISNILNGMNSLPNLANLFNILDAGKTAISGDNTTSASFNTYLANLNAWDASNPQPVSFNLSFNFALGKYGIWNAREEVVKPILALMAPAMIRNLTPYTMSGPYPTAYDLIGKTLASFKESFKTEVDASQESANQIGNFLEKLVTQQYENYTFDVQFGNFITFSDMLLQDVSDIKFSADCDQKGFPVFGGITLKFVGIRPLALTADKGSNIAVRFGHN